ncbi:MAG: 5-oxoprolinase subunit B family protein [Jatrophihabitans sp.]
MRVLPSGDHALLIELADLRETRAFADAVIRNGMPGVREIVPAARTVLLLTEPGTDLRTVAAAATAIEYRETSPAELPEPITIGVRYAGTDLADVAALTGLDEAGVVAAHTGQIWTVAFCGFAPGFGYLVGENWAPNVPRRDSPRTSVPAGSVGLAGEFTGVYPRVSPGGWQLIGRTDAPLWDVHRDPPALLRPGVRVRFVEDPT